MVAQRAGILVERPREANTKRPEVFHSRPGSLRAEVSGQRSDPEGSVASEASVNRFVRGACRVRQCRSSYGEEVLNGTRDFIR